MSDEIFHEINEDLRQQQLRIFWKENGAWIIGGVVAAVIFTGVLSFWRDHEFQENMAATAALSAAMEAADPAKLEAYAETADKNHAMMARFSAAQIYAVRHKADKAAALYRQVAETSRLDRAWRDLAGLYAVGQRLDKDDSVEMHKELSRLSKAKSAWRYSAMEMDALLYARENKMIEAAEALTRMVVDPMTPPDIRARAATLRELYLGESATSAVDAKKDNG